MKKYISLFVALSVIGLNACLDEDPLFDPSKVKNVVEFYDLQNPNSSVDAPYRLYVNSYEISTAEEHAIMISYSGAHANNNNIEVQLEVDPQALVEYNEYVVATAVANGDTLADGNPDFSHIQLYELMPSNFYTLDTEVTIEKGETKAPVTVSVNTSLFDFAKAYVLPLRIVSTSSGVISGNYGAVLFNIGAKNQFHGAYQSTGLRTNYNAFGDWNGACCPAGGTIASTGPWNFATTNVLTVNEFMSTVHAANDNGGFGTINITVTATDATPGVTTDNVVVVNVAPNGSTALTNLVPMTGKVSTYDYATKKFDLYYMYTNTNGTFRTVEHHLTKL